MGSSNGRANRDPDRPDILHATFDWDVVRPSMAIVRTVAIAADCETTELPPLIEFINPDVVDRLFHHTANADRELSVSFRMSDYSVTITEGGDVFVQAERVAP